MTWSGLLRVHKGSAACIFTGLSWCLESLLLAVPGLPGMWLLLYSSFSQVLPSGETTVTSGGFCPACCEVSLLEPWLATEE